MPIFIARNGSSSGPFSEEDVLRMVSGGLVAGSDLAWREGLEGWVRLDQIVPEQPKLTSPPPLPDIAGQRATVTSTAVPTPAGVGGWLFLFAVGLVVLGPLFQGSQLYATWKETHEAAAQFPVLQSLWAFEVLVQVVLIFYGMVVGVLLLRDDRRSIRAAKLYLLARVSCFVAAEFLILSILRKHISAELFRGAVSDIGIEVFREVVYFAVWGAYFKYSKRVRNTLALWRLV